jgi:hypothetical protein
LPFRGDCRIGGIEGALRAIPLGHSPIPGNRGRSNVTPLRHSVAMPKQSSYDREKLDRIRVDQRRVILRRQALACGMPSSTIDHQIRPGGPWQVLLPGVYLTNTGTVTQDHREIAALLYAGDGSVITGPCAVRRHRLESPGANTVDVLVSPGVERHSRGFVRLHRTYRMPQSWMTTGPIRFANAPRAVADAVRGMTSVGDARTVIFGALQKRACSLGELLNELTEGPARGRRLFRGVLAEAADGARSAAENDLQRLLARGLDRLSQPMLNARLYTLDGQFIAMVDDWWEKQSLAGDVDSKAYHISAEAQDRDRDRHNKLIAHGINLMHFSPRRIREDGAGVLRDVKAALLANSGRPPLPIVAVGPEEAWTREAAERVRQRLAARQPAGSPVSRGAA